MSYHQLTPQERIRIEVLRTEDYSISLLAEKLGRHKSTISRELRRVTDSQYTAQQTQAHHDCKKAHIGRQNKVTTDLISLLKDRLREDRRRSRRVSSVSAITDWLVRGDETPSGRRRRHPVDWSPEQITGRLLSGQVSFKTVYRWIYQGIISIPVSALRHAGKRRKAPERRGVVFRHGRSITERPEEVGARKTKGHWEADTIVSSRGKSKGCLATFVERKSRLYVAFKMADRQSESMQSAIEQRIGLVGSDEVKTITTDRGKEFACYRAVEEDHGIPMYFADPYSAWQRGSNENSNGLLRQYFPKRSDLATISDEALREALLKVNNRPRKCLGWRTPLETFLHEPLHFI